MAKSNHIIRTRRLNVYIYHNILKIIFLNSYFVKPFYIIIA